MTPRQERRQLKQKLFAIRRWYEGDDVVLTDELKTIKKRYESNKNFTSWSDFPEKWDIGDPFGVKQTAAVFNDVDKANYQKILGKSYGTIINLFQSHEELDRSNNESVLD
jgi:hypothetical protein